MKKHQPQNRETANVASNETIINMRYCWILISYLCYFPFPYSMLFQLAFTKTKFPISKKCRHQISRDNPNQIAIDKANFVDIDCCINVSELPMAGYRLYKIINFQQRYRTSELTHE